MRSLHRDLGFFLIGLIVIYSLSGIVLVYRNTSLLKTEKKIEKTLNPNMSPDELLNSLKIRGAKVISNENNLIEFTNGSYDATTGVVVYNIQETIFPMNKFISLHKTIGTSPMHWIATVVGVILFFLAISSFWMFKPNTRLFKRGLVLASIGVVFTAIIIFFA